MKSIQKFFPYFLIAGIIINANGLLLDILEPDGALYATIAKHIAITGDWLNLFGDGHDWLDKPHFPFWISALSFKIFGITAFAYKLPAFIFWLTGISFTYRLAKDLYDKSTAMISVLVYVFALHGILNNFDVRAEPYLTAFIISAIYYIHRASLSSKWKYIILAALTSAGAVMTKGIFSLLTIGAGFIIFWIITKQWKQFLNYRWYAMLFLILLFITPELYSLYNQFDLHPEKVVFGKTNVSGIRFFFWDSQFGRFFNTGPIKGHGDPSFFLHTTLWAFLPWSVIFYIAVYNLIKKGKGAESFTTRWVVYGSALITFFLFSFSGFQLPHYIVILFPHFSIITAGYLNTINKESTYKKINVLQSCLLVLSTFFVCFLAFYVKTGNVLLVAAIVIGVAIFTITYFREAGLLRLITRSIAICFVLFLFLFNFFYPKLLQYQSGMVAGKFMTDKKLLLNAATLNASSYSFEFYAPGVIQYLNSLDDLNNFIKKDTAVAIYTNKHMLYELEQKGYHFIVLQELPYFHVSMLTGSFLNPATRSSQLEKMVLILIRRS